MIAFKYTKTDGAQFFSHLDLLRHVYRTLRRAGIEVEMSGGYHAHARIFLNNPLAVGVRSVAEYAAVDTAYDGDFKSAFNAFSPDGVKCLDYRVVPQNPNYAESIDKCDYAAVGIAPFDTEEFMREQSIVITDLRGREVDIRPRIYSLEADGDTLKFTLGCGNFNLRPDLFTSYLCSRCGGKVQDILKLSSHGKGVF